MLLVVWLKDGLIWAHLGRYCLQMELLPSSGHLETQVTVTITFVSSEGVGNATACVMGDKIYVTGGHYGYRGSCTYEKIQVYRPDVNEWSIITISPNPGMRKRNECEQ